MIWLLVFTLCGGFCSILLQPQPEAPLSDTVQMKFDALHLLEPGDSLLLDTDLAIMAGRRVWIQPYEYCRMVDMGFWPLEPLLADVRSKKFSTIELYDMPEQYLLPSPIVKAVGENYRLEARKFGRLWFRPN